MCVAVPPLQDDKRVYRTLMRAADFQGGRPLLQAFLRRNSDPSGLSVDYDVEVPGGCATALTGKKKAVLRLQVGQIRATAFGLDVTPTSPTHANIVGAPSYDEMAQDAAVAERAQQIAAKLIELSDIEWMPPANQ